MTEQVHLCLLSEQPSPNLCALLDPRLKPQEVMFVTSPQQKARYQWQENVLRPRGLKVSQLSIDDANLFEPVLDVMEAEIDRRKALGQHILINASGGTKPMAIAAHMAGFNKDVPVFYVQNDRVYWLNNPEQRDDFDLEDHLKLEPFLQAHGREVAKRKPPQMPPAYRQVFDGLIQKPSYAAQVKTLNWLAWKADQNKSLSIPLPANQQKDDAFQALLDTFAGAGLVKASVDTLRFADESARALCNGFWLEDYCFGVANELRGASGGSLDQLQDVARSVEVKTPAQGGKPVDNELDVVLLYANRLHIIECKTRQFDSENPDVANALYKLATLSREVGGVQSRAMFVSFYPLRDNDKRRAKALGIEVVDGEALKDLRSRLVQWLNPRG